MEKPIALVDVMNVKSSNHMRHSIDIKYRHTISQYYARETRIYNAVFDKESSRYIRGKYWFTNIIVFDFDIEEGKELYTDPESYLNNCLTKLFSILGKPKYIIRNKNSYSREEIDKYFTIINPKTGEKKIKTPKKFGCQVVYELSESLKSEYVEQVKLYHLVRQKINMLTNADTNFKGHMFKNYDNKTLFNVVENNDFDVFNLKEIANKLLDDKTLVSKVFALGPYEKLNGDMPKSFKKLNRQLTKFYSILNQWKLKFNIDNKENNNSNNNNYRIPYKCFSSRNETLFNFLKYLNDAELNCFSYNDYISNDKLYSNCEINDPLDEYEFNTTKNSILNFRSNNDIEFNSNAGRTNLNIDLRVFKEDQLPLNLKFFKENESKFNIKNFMHKKNITVNIHGKMVKIELYNCNDDNNSNIKCINDQIYSKIISNIFLHNPLLFLTNINSIFTPDLVTYLNNMLTNMFSLEEKFTLYQMYDIIRSAVFLTHFKLYHSIKKNKAKKKKKGKNSKRKFKSNSIHKYYGLKLRYNNKNILGFEKFYNRLKRNKLLREDGSPYAISYYQQYFHIKNLIASIYVRNIKYYCKISSERNNNIINIFIIYIVCYYYNLFIYIDKYIYDSS